MVNQPKGSLPEYLTMSEGEKQGSIEVLANGIDITNGIVKIKIAGVPKTLSFEKTGISAKPVAGGLKLPSGRSTSAFPRPTPLGGRGSTGIPAPSIPRPPTKLNFQRPVRTTPVPSASTGSSGGNAGSFQFNIPSPNSGAGATRRIRISTDPASLRGNNVIEAPKVDAAEQTVLIEINRAITQDAVNNGDMPPLPPTDLSPPTPQ